MSSQSESLDCKYGKDCRMANRYKTRTHNEGDTKHVGIFHKDLLDCEYGNACTFLCRSLISFMEKAPSKSDEKHICEEHLISNKELPVCKDGLKCEHLLLIAKKQPNQTAVAHVNSTNHQMQCSYKSSCVIRDHLHLTMYSH